MSVMLSLCSYLEWLPSDHFGNGSPSNFSRARFGQISNQHCIFEAGYWPDVVSDHLNNLTT